jgi:transposase
MCDTPAMLRELKVVEQRYQAVLQVLDGTPVTEAERFGVARQTVHRWLARYRESGIGGLADRSHAPKAHPWRISAEVEAVICDLRRATSRDIRRHKASNYAPGQQARLVRRSRRMSRTW